MGDILHGIATTISLFSPPASVNMLRLPGLIYRNKFDLPSLPPPGTFDGKKVLITGASSGLGFETAVHYVNLGASSVIITARTPAKGNTAKEAIEAATGKEDIVHVMELEMSTFASTHEFASKVKEEVKDIDIVLLNAGLINTSHKMGKEGYEVIIQVHVLSTALLALELLPWMKGLGGGKERHLGFVTSGLHRGVKIGEKDGWPQVDVLRYLSMEEHWPKKPGMYDVSKLLEQYVVNEVAKLSGYVLPFLKYRGWC
jgi:NAD(P)-dependent dehydrogenase (short-subunit alcohol dehydrogenase family)